jgi:hypothetical protein
LCRLKIEFLGPALTDPTEYVSPTRHLRTETDPVSETMCLFVCLVQWTGVKLSVSVLYKRHGELQTLRRRPAGAASCGCECESSCSPPLHLNSVAF